MDPLRQRFDQTLAESRMDAALRAGRLSPRELLQLMGQRRRATAAHVAARRHRYATVTPPSEGGGGGDGWDAVLPQWTAPSSLTARPATTGTVYECSTPAEVYAAFAAIKAAGTWGNEIRLDAGVVFADSNHFVLPAVAGWEDGRFNIMTTSAEASLPALPASGVAGSDLSIRVNPTEHAAMMPTLRQNATNTRRLGIERGAAGWYLRGLRFDMDPADAVTNYALVHIGPADPNDSAMESSYAEQTLVADLPHHIVLQQCIVHTDHPNMCYHNIRVDAHHVAILNSHTYGFGHEGGDANGIWWFLGEGKGLIDNCFIAHNTENFLTGGADITAAHWEGILCEDITISRCRMWKDPRYFRRHPRWLAKYLQINGNPPSVKNIFELKWGRRIHVKDVVLEGAYEAGQTGQAIHIKTMNQSGQMQWAQTRDVTFENVYGRYVGTCIEIISDQITTGGPVSPAYGRPNYRVKVRNVAINCQDILNPVVGHTYEGQDIYTGAKTGVTYYLYDGAIHRGEPEFPVTHAYRTEHSTFMGVRTKGWAIFSGEGKSYSPPTKLGRSHIQNTVFGSDYTGQKFDGSSYSPPDESSEFHELALARHFDLTQEDHFRYNVLSRRLASDYDGWSEPVYVGASNAALGLNADGTLDPASPLKAGGAMEAMDGADNGVDWDELNAAIAGVIQANDTATYADHDDLSP